MQDSENPDEAKWVHLKRFLSAIWSKKTFHGSFKRPLGEDDLTYLGARVLSERYT